MTGLTTGCLAIDLISGIGGFPRGRIAEVFGLESSGKSTLCLQACATAQRDGLYAVYLDMERAVNLDHATKIGFVFDDDAVGFYDQPKSFEECARIIDQMIDKGSADVVVVDSIPAMVPEAEMKGDIMEAGALALRGRLLSNILPKLVDRASSRNTALVFVNQMRANIETSAWLSKFAPREKPTGGYAIRFVSSLRFHLKLKKEGLIERKVADPFRPGEEKKVPVANLHWAKAYKNKVGDPYQECQFVIRYDAEHHNYGIDNLQTILDLARHHGVIEEKAGGRFMFSGATPEHTFSTHGAESAYTYLREHPEIVAEIVGRIPDLPKGFKL